MSASTSHELRKRARDSDDDDDDDDDDDEEGSPPRTRRRLQSAAVRPPLWLARKATRNPWRASLAHMKDKQLMDLNRFRQLVSKRDFGTLQHRHFDWWMFPIDDGSREQYNVGGEADVQELRGDAVYVLSRGTGCVG